MIEAAFASHAHSCAVAITEKIIRHDERVEWPPPDERPIVVLTHHVPQQWIEGTGVTHVRFRVLK